MPKVSVIIPAYNEELYVEEAVLSALNQTIKDQKKGLTNPPSGFCFVEGGLLTIGGLCILLLVLISMYLSFKK